jgi:adenine deaminase
VTACLASHMESLSNDQRFRANLVVRNATLVYMPAAPARAGRPAAAFGTGTGTIAPGEPGDLVLLDKLATVTDLATVRTTVRAGQVTWPPAATSSAERDKDGAKKRLADAVVGLRVGETEQRAHLQARPGAGQRDRTPGPAGEAAWETPPR